MSDRSRPMPGAPSRSAERRRSAFTLVELLVVVAIIALLLAILLPSLAKARDLTKHAVCMSNQRQIGLAISTYLNDWGRRMLTTRVPAESGPNYSELWDKALVRATETGTVEHWGNDGRGRTGTFLICPSDRRIGASGEPPYGSYGLHHDIGWPNFLGYNPPQGKYEPVAHWERDFINRETFMGPRNPATLPIVFDAQGRRVLEYYAGYYNWIWEHRHVSEGDGGTNFLFADFHAEYMRADKDVVNDYPGAIEDLFRDITW